MSHCVDVASVILTAVVVALCGLTPATFAYLGKACTTTLDIELSMC